MFKLTNLAVFAATLILIGCVGTTESGPNCDMQKTRDWATKNPLETIQNGRRPGVNQPTQNRSQEMLKQNMDRQLKR